jgi:alkaline phosphatase D
MRQQPNRRDFIRTVAIGTVATGSVAALSGCSIGGFDFLHGVASGDPLSDRVILWTRVTPDEQMLDTLAELESGARRSAEARAQLAQARRIPVSWEVATDAACRNVIGRGIVVTNADRDYTVKVDVRGLRPGGTYYFRFGCLGLTSVIGRTRTLGTLGVQQVKLAVFSCSNYPAGFFNVYAEAAKRDDLDACVHLGDYIYEYGAGGYASADAAALGRESVPAVEILALADYRARHAQYKTDVDLQALHARVPMIAVWDDHEVTNDAWKNGAENHQPATEGDFSVRRAAAIRAYHEWMPIRTGSDPASIYRSFDFGDMVSLHMLDTRLIGRDQQLDYANYFTASGFDAAAFSSAIGDPSRQLLGATQAAWLQQRLASSAATWQVLGQQVLMGRMNIPAPILQEGLNPGTGVTVSAYAAIVAKARSGQTLSPQEQFILQQPAIPYNLDAWDGYFVARETLLGTCRALDKNLVVLAGDTHNAWANDLLDLGGNAIGVEFATASVSSPGFESIFPDENPAVLAGSLTELIGPLVYCDTARRGFMLVTASRGECQAEWIYVNNIASRSYTASRDRVLKTLPGAANRRLVPA